MSLVRVLLISHLAALVFGLAGLLIALPNPHLWASSPLGVEVFALGMQHAGALQIVLGAATMLAFGARVLGWWKTGTFCVAAVVLSLASELIGTTTGWPFGTYSYTEGLGTKVLGRVPYTIPLSWFYMGFASYVLASITLARSPLRPRAWAAVVLGAWLLLVWDLVLDPAMAHTSLPVQFWVWHDTGPYFGMPIQNLLAWFLTGLAFMGVSRLIWHEDPVDAAPVVGVPLLIYLANFAFAAGLSASVGLWQPIPLALASGLAPVAVLTWVSWARQQRVKASGLAGP